MYLQNLQYLLVEAVIVGLDIVMLLVDKKATHICVSFAHMDTHVAILAPAMISHKEQYVQIHDILLYQGYRT